MEQCCSKCNNIRIINHHHITYEPEKIAVLCVFCHSMITSINTRYAKWKGKVKLSNVERKSLYAFFMNTDKAILEAVLRKKDKTKAKKTSKPISRKKLAKYNPLYREDEAAYIDRLRENHIKKMLSTSA